MNEWLGYYMLSGRLDGPVVQEELQGVCPLLSPDASLSQVSIGTGFVKVLSLLLSIPRYLYTFSVTLYFSFSPTKVPWDLWLHAVRRPVCVGGKDKWQTLLQGLLPLPRLLHSGQHLEAGEHYGTERSPLSEIIPVLLHLPCRLLNCVNAFYTS